MLDLRLLRENPAAVKAALSRRDPAFAETIDEILARDAETRSAETRLQELQARRKALSKSIGQLRAKGEDTTSLENEVRALGEEMDALSKRTAELESLRRDLLLRIPNLPQSSVPDGSDASGNRIVRSWGTPSKLERVEDHVTIASRLGLMDFERAAKIAGSGFVVFTGRGAKLERALISFLLDLHSEQHGYQEVNTPYVIRRECMEGTGQLPKFEEDMYSLRDDPLFLAPTAEVPVTNLHRDELLALDDLPIKYVAYSPCFRREAGATGRDNRGIIRMHQFDKVELVKICHPEESDAELESLTADAERVLQLLDLPYQVVDLCAGDLGFSSTRTYDLEVWSPGQNGFLEVSSCSNFRDYQARRMNLRFKDADGKNKNPHTLNGSGTALARLVVALLENHLRADGSVAIPEPLQPYFGASEIR
jgi:seryl-tRNA synthetase